MSSKDGDNRNGNYSERTKIGGILRIPDMNMLAGDRWREFNTTNEMWPSIDGGKDNEVTHSKVMSYSSIVRIAPPPATTAPIEDKKVSVWQRVCLVFRKGLVRKCSLLVQTRMYSIF